METSAKISPCFGDLKKLAEIEYEHHPGIIYNHWITVIYSFVLFLVSAIVSVPISPAKIKAATCFQIVRGYAICSFEKNKRKPS